MKKKFTFKFMFLLCVLVMGTISALADTYTMWLDSGTKNGTRDVHWTSNNATLTHSNVSWNASFVGGSIQNSNYYVQIGSGSSPFNTITLSTSGISGTITEVKVGCGAYQSRATVAVTVGGNAFGGNAQTVGVAPDNNNPCAQKTFSGSASGAIVITITNDSNGRAGYIDYVSVTYTQSSTPVDPDITFNNGNVYVGKTLDLSTLFSSNSNGAVTYTITSGNSYASIEGSEITGIAAGTVTVQASQEQTASYNAATATATITVSPYVQPTTVKINMNYQWLGSGNGSNLSDSQMPVEKNDDNVITTIAKGTSTTNPRGDGDYIRLYTGSTLTFDAPTDYEITSIVFTTGGSGTWNNPTVSTGTLSSTTWTGNATSVVFTMTGSCFISKATITLAVPSSVATPTFSSAAGTYVGTQNVTISCETTGNTIYYTVDGSTPTNASTQYTAAISIDKTTTLKAIAYVGTNASAVASATYTIVQPLTTMQAIYDKSVEVGSTQTIVYITFDGWVVSGANSYIAYVTDGTKGFVINTSSHGFSAGDVLSSDDPIQCILNTYGGVACLRNFTKTAAQNAGVEVTSGSATLANIALADLLPVNSGALVHYDNLTCSVNSGTYTLTDGTTSIKVYTSLYNSLASSLTDGKKYNITGVYTYYNENEICPRDANDIVEVTTPVLSADDVNIGYNVTSGSITYTLENPVSGGVLTAAITAGNVGNWLTIGEVAANVPFTCSVNNGNERNATVRLTYTYYTSETVTKDVIVTQAAEPTPALYTYSVNGEEGDTFDGIVGGEITLATGSNFNDDYTFAGWTTDPEDVSIRLTGTYTLMEEVTTFYAVYAHTTGAAADSYVKVTSLDDIVAGEYIIVSDGYYLQNDEVTAKNGFPCDGKTVTIVNDEISNVTSDMLWTFTGTKTEMSIKTGNFVLYNVSDNNGMRNTTNAWAGTWSFSANSTGFKMMYSSTSRYCGIYSASAGVNTNWRSYSGTGNYVDSGILYLYKKQSGSTGTTHYYTRVYDATTTEIDNIPATSVVTVPNGVTLTLTGTNKGDETNLIIEDGGQLKVTNNATVKATVKKTVDDWTGPVSSKADDDGWYAISSPVNNIAITDFVKGTHNVYRYDEPTAYWNEYRSDDGVYESFEELENGRGYLYRSTSDEGIEFKGTVNSGNADGEVEYDLSFAYNGSNTQLKGFNLVGNPFTHNITWNDNITVSNVFNDGFYMLVEEDGLNKGKWGACTNTTTIAPTKAFLVQAKDASPSITINNNVPATTKGTNYANDNIMFVVKNAEYSDEAYVLFKKGQGLNKIEHRNAEIPMLYVISEGENYAIADMPDNTDVINLGFEAKTMGQYTISLKAEGQYSYMHLVDKLTGNDIDMLVEDSYTFVGTPNDRNDRFVLRLNYNAAGIDTESDIFAYQSGNEIIVNGEGTLEVFDVTGRKVMATTINGVQTVNGLNNGFYIFRLNEKIQKIVVR